MNLKKQKTCLDNTVKCLETSVCTRGLHVLEEAIVHVNQVGSNLIRWQQTKVMKHFGMGREYVINSTRGQLCQSVCDPRQQCLWCLDDGLLLQILHHPALRRSPSIAVCAWPLSERWRWGCRCGADGGFCQGSAGLSISVVGLLSGAGQG